MNRGRELMVGTVIIVSILIAVVGTLWLQGTNFGRPLTSVEFLVESASQLKEGNAATYRGVRIGRVDRIRVEPAADAVRVTLLLEEAIQLPADAGVVLSPESLFGDWQAEIVSRSLYPAFPFFDVPNVRAVGDVPVYGGYALPELSRLTASAEQISGNLADLTARLELAINQETADNLARAIGNIEAITQEVRLLVQQQGEVAANITANADSALMEIEVAAQAARRSFERVDGMIAGERIDSILGNIEVASSGFRRLSQDLSDPEYGLAATLQRADSAFTRIDRLAARMEAGEGSLGRLLVDSTLAIRAEDLLLQLDMLLLDVRENPRRYVRLSIF